MFNSVQQGINAIATKRVADILSKLSWQDKIDLMKEGHFRSKIIDNPNITLDDIYEILDNYRKNQEKLSDTNTNNIDNDNINFEQIIKDTI